MGYWLKQALLRDPEQLLVSGVFGVHTKIPGVLFDLLLGGALALVTHHVVCVFGVVALVLNLSAQAFFLL